MTMKTKNLTGTLLAVLLLTTSCAKKAVEEALTAGAPATDGSQTAAGLAGTGQVCDVLASSGSAMNGLGVVRYLVLGADGSYNYSIYFSNHVGCVTSANSGGNNIATYSQSGTFAVGGIATAPSTATKITFTPTSSTMTLRAGTYSADATEIALKAWLNGCTGGSLAYAGADSTQSVVNSTCAATGNVSLAGTFPFTGITYSNIGYKSGSNLDSGTRSDIWSPGAVGTTFPSSYTETWGTFQ